MNYRATYTQTNLNLQNTPIVIKLTAYLSAGFPNLID